MRKSILISLLFIVFSTVVYSQDKSFSLGVRGSMNLSSLKVDYGTTDPKIGYQAGIVVEYKLPHNFFIQSGLSYSMRYGKEDVSYFYQGTDDFLFASITKTKIKSHYLQVPVSIGYKINVSKHFSLNYNLGTYFAYGVGGKTKTDIAALHRYLYHYYQGDDIPRPEYRAFSDDTFSDSVFKRFDMGLLFGMGAEYKRITLNMNYELGLKNMAHDSEYHNRNLVFSLGYRIF